MSLKIEFLIDEILKNNFVKPEAILNNTYRPFSDKLKILNALATMKQFLTN